MRSWFAIIGSGLLATLVAGCVFERDSRLWDPENAVAIVEPGRYKVDGDSESYFEVEANQPGRYTIRFFDASKKPALQNVERCSTHPLPGAFFALQCRVMRSSEGKAPAENDTVKLYVVRRTGSGTYEGHADGEALEAWLKARLGAGPWLEEQRLTGDARFDRALLRAYAREVAPKVPEGRRWTARRIGDRSGSSP